MIPIKIDEKKIEFRDLHVSKIKTDIENSLITKRSSYKDTDFEYGTLNWIIKYLDDILNAETKKMRVIIRDFNWSVKRKISIVKLSITGDNTTVEQLKNICRENSIRGFSNKTKDELISLVNANSNLNGKTIDNLKFTTLIYRINQILKDVFIDFYKNGWDKIEDYDRYTFVTKHNLKTCPYCNMGYILISERDKNKKNGLRPEIDHFFPKAIYPYLAMSFYNLIPSCQVCNHTKSNKDTFVDNLLSPYEIDSTTFKLTYQPKNMNFLQIKKRKYNFNSFDIKFKKIDKYSNKYFKLDKLYEQHKDVVLELLIKRTIYSKSYIEELKRNFHFTDDEIYRFLFCNYKESEEFNKRPLSKLINDIIDELGASFTTIKSHRHFQSKRK